MKASKIDKHQTFKRSSSVSIKPYIDERSSNMGLENYGMALFDGVYHEESIVCLEQNGIKRYVTGLNEFAPEVKMLPQDEKEAKIKEIRAIVSEVEKELFGNVIDVKSETFWKEVQGLHPSNSDFWEQIKIQCSNDPVFLDPRGDVYDLIKLKAIEAGGFSIVAPSLETVRKNKKFRFYLDKYEETASIKTEVKKLRNKALSELQKLYETNVEKLMLVCKVIDANSSQYKKSTPIDILYDNMDNYIMGNTVETNKKQTAKRFLEVTGFDMETLKIKALIKDASYFRVIATRGDGHIYHEASHTNIGRNPSDAVEFLKNPINDDLLKSITIIIEKRWND